jgi:hypothetical protein
MRSEPKLKFALASSFTFRNVLPLRRIVMRTATHLLKHVSSSPKQRIAELAPRSLALKPRLRAAKAAPHHVKLP